MSYGRFSSKKGMEKAIAAGLKETDFEGNEKITVSMINKKLKPKKPKKIKKPKKSAYKAQYFTGENEEVANLIGQFFTTNHSDKNCR